MLRVEMLSTGDEVLHGQIVDTNAAWLADYLFTHGLPMSARQTVGDNLALLIETLQARSQIADILIVNGGLGPTSDDLTAQAAALACGVELVENAEWIARIEAFFIKRNRPMAETNRKQAWLPANAQLLDNRVGTACGFALKLNRCMIYFTPGVPSEFKVMVDEQIMPRLRACFTIPEPNICLRLTTFGTSESELAAKLDSVPLPNGVVLGYRSSTPIIELKLTGPATQQQEMEKIWQYVRQVAGVNKIFEGVVGLPALVSQLLEQHNLSLFLSEQFSAGLIYWRLQQAGAALLGGELLCDACQESLDELMVRALTVTSRFQAPLVLAISALDDNGLVSVVLHTPDGAFAQSVDYSMVRSNLKQCQESVAVLALDMLRRYLQKEQVCVQYGWLKVVRVLEQ